MINPINIAIVDDELDMHTICKAIFSNEVKNNLFNTFYFSNGKECYDFIQDEHEKIKVILVLSDLQMPIMDGFTLLELIKKNYPEISVYIISAYGSDDYISKAKKLGAEDFFVKPINFSRLKKQILEEFIDYSK